jgi:hypothetical protein
MNAVWVRGVAMMGPEGDEAVENWPLRDPETDSLIPLALELHGPREHLETIARVSTTFLLALYRAED